MKKFLYKGILAIAALCTAAVAQSNVPKHVRYDLEIAPPSGMLARPSLGGLTGVGRTYSDPSFPGSLMFRCTDYNTYPSHNQFQTADNGGTHSFSLDDTMVALTIVNKGWTQVFNVDAAHHTCSPIPGGLFPTGHREFSYMAPRRLFTMEGSKIYQNDLSPTGIVKRTLIKDYHDADCLGTAFQVKWAGIFGSDLHDQIFAQALSNTGAQETGHTIVAYKVGVGCRVLNTATGEVTGSWGPTGTISTPNRLLMHEGSLSEDGIHFRYETNRHCLAGGCAAPELWNINTLDVETCGAALDCGGHSANGTFHIVNGSGTGNWWARAMTSHGWTQTPPRLIPQDLVPVGLIDQQHTSWGNDVNDTQPFYATYYGKDNGFTSPFHSPWAGELIGVAHPNSPQGAVPFRVIHTFNTALNPNFVAAQAIGQASHSGKLFALTTDGLGTFGSTSGRATCNPKVDCMAAVAIVVLN